VKPRVRVVLGDRSQNRERYHTSPWGSSSRGPHVPSRWHNGPRRVASWSIY